jgi:MFS family permease
MQDVGSVDPYGHLADRVGRKAVLQWTILCYSAGVFLSGFAVGLWTLLAARVLTAVGVSLRWRGTPTFLPASHWQQHFRCLPQR